MSTQDSTNTIKQKGARFQRNYQNFNNKPGYVQKLPLWDRYRRGIVFSAALFSVLIFYSAPLYQFLRTPPPNIDPRSTMWPGELAKGKTYTQQYKERLQRIKERKEAAEKGTN